MMLTLNDQDLKQAIINWVANELEQEDSSGISVIRITRHQGGSASADVKVNTDG